MKPDYFEVVAMIATLRYDLEHNEWYPVLITRAMIEARQQPETFREIHHQDPDQVKTQVQSQHPGQDIAWLDFQSFWTILANLGIQREE